MKEPIIACPYCGAPMPSPVMTRLLFGVPAGAGKTYTSAMSSCTIEASAPYVVANCGDEYCRKRASEAHRTRIE